MYDSRRCPKAKGKRMEGSVVRESQLPSHMESLFPDVAVVGLLGEGHKGGARWLGKASGAHVCDQGGPPLSLQHSRSSATSLRARLWLDGGVGLSQPGFPQTNPATRACGMC